MAKPRTKERQRRRQHVKGGKQGRKRVVEKQRRPGRKARPERKRQRTNRETN